jgi:urea transport system substrate-binding protein
VFRKRWVLLGIGLGVFALLVFAGYLLAGSTVAKPPIMVGLLHSMTGPLGASEKPMVDAEVLALEEINAAGGLLGREVKWVIADGRSQPATFADQAQQLIARDRVSVLFGVFASHCRKAVKPVVEEKNHLLLYPAAYEGLETSPNIVYVGGPANQQVFPAVGWCREVLKARKFYLAGSDTVRARVVNALVHDQLRGHGGQVSGEEYVPPDSTDVAGLVDKIKEAAPDVVISTLEGAANAPFYEGLARAGVRADKTPVVSFSITEEELRTLPLKDVAGHYAAWHYFQSVDRPENAAFVRKFKARYGADRVTNDGATCAYNGVRLWAQTVTEAGTDDVPAVRKAVRRQSLDAAEGVVSIDAGNLQNWRPFLVGKIRPDGQFDVVFTLPKPIYPVPFPATRLRAEWDVFLRELSAGWKGQWLNPERSAPGPR